MDEWARLDRALADFRKEVIANRWPLGIYLASAYLLVLVVTAIRQMFVGW